MEIILTSTYTELSNYLDNWLDPLSPSDLAHVLGLSLATIRVYKSRMDTNPTSNQNLLPQPQPQPLPRRGKRVIYTKAAVIEWWLSIGDNVPIKKRGRPQIADVLKRKGVF